jgi:uncharacterized iron-regulated protein
MKKIVFFFCIVSVSMSGGLKAEELAFYDLNEGSEIKGARALSRLEAARIVLVGEHHTDPDHHRAQLSVIRALHRSGRKPAIGLEMFRKESQKDLDRWSAGKLNETDFRKIYLDNWGFDWELYRPIFIYARDNGIPLVGLNVPRSITRQVAYHGFDSLTEAQKGELEGIACDVTPAYREFIGRAYGAHAHGHMKFENFCEAQLVWDAAMAVHALGYLEAHPDTVMVLLAGSGHARKMGIPAQLEERSELPYLVILPHTPGVFDKETIGAEDADLLLQDP